MSNGLLGRKLGMTSYFGHDGRYLPVTVIEAGPCTVTQIKTKANDGYDALQLSFGEKKKNRVNKPLQGHFAKSGDKCFAEIGEFSVENPDDFQLGQEVTLEMFSVGERIEVSGTTKGRGFSGVIKRHGFHRGPKTHGNRNYRLPGAIGMSAWPSKVAKGKKLPGRYGNARQTVKNLEIVDIRPDDNLILVKGAIPGPASGRLEIKKRR
ncbi:MAG: 50S ribosomal protein L3 [Desulfobacterales bacterium]|nr:50S ribosomal protein L3 [Desulfobacterales bacterium]